MQRTALPVRSILRAIADAASRWRDGDFPPRVRALDGVSERTGYSAPVVEYAFDRLFDSLTYAAFEETIAGELGSLDVLDRFVQGGSKARFRALPVGRVCVISSHTTIGVAIVPAAFALAAGCEVVVKDREDHLVAAFFATLAQERAEFAASAQARPWLGESDGAGLSTFDAVAAFGNDTTLQQIRAALPLHTRMIPFGSKISIGYVTREALAGEQAARRLAEAAARDLVLYETEGCMSLHALFVERRGNVDPETFAHLLARAVERSAIEFPPRLREPAVATRLGAARDMAAFRTSTGRGAFHSDSAASFLVALDPPGTEPPSLLPRALDVRTVDGPQDATAYLERHALSVEAVATAHARADITDMAVALGAARITSLGELQAPPLFDRHGGRPRISDFIRWITDETP